MEDPLKIQVRDSAPAIGEEALSGVEGRLGLVLPADYRSFLTEHNGGIPRPEWFLLWVRKKWVTARRSQGSLRWFGQSYTNDTVLEHRNEWHRVSRFLGVTSGVGPESGRPGFEQAYRDRPSGMPVHLAPVADVEGFGVNGQLCLDVSADGPGRGRVYYWPDIVPSTQDIAPAPLAPSFNALLEILRYPGDPPPEWLTLVQDGDLDLFRRWLDKNISRLRDKDELGWTALDHAVFEGRWDIATYLMEKRDVTPGMVFYDALNDGRFSTARGMLRFPIDPDLTGPSLARKAEEFWTDLDMVRAFLDAGADLEYIDNVASYGNSPLHYATQAGELEAVRLLLARGADPTVENEQGESPRDLAARAGHAQIVEALDEAAAKQPARASFEDESQEVDIHSVVIAGSAGGLDEDALVALEARLQVRLPGEYRGFLKRFNGGKPRPTRFRFRDDEDDSAVKCQVKCFLSVGGEPRFAEVTDLESTRDDLADWGLPRRMLPIASVDDEISGGLLCISLRGKDRGGIAYYPQNDSSESTTYPVAKSLSRFFARLSKAKDKTPTWVRAIEDDNPDSLATWLTDDGNLKKRYRGRTPLELAVGEGKIRVVRWLLEQGTEAEAAFQLAVEAGQAEVMLDLLGREGFQPSVPASILGSFFFAPAVWRSVELVGRLIDLGADVNASGGSGQTPLMIGAQHATPEVLQLLIGRGARANVWSPQGETSLHRAVCSASRPEMMEKMSLLIDAGESLHARAPHSALPDHVLRTARAMQAPIGDLLNQGGPQASLLKGILESLADHLKDLPVEMPSTPPGDTYFGQFQRTAAELLMQIRKDAEALAELEAYTSKVGPEAS
jgi:ankyrin repeat protein